MFNDNYSFTFLERFLSYVKFNTQSQEGTGKTPSTDNQKLLANFIVDELHKLGLSDAFVNEFGYVFVRLPSNSDKKIAKVGFLSHLDTSPDAPGKDVSPIVHKNYSGGDISLPKNETIISPSDSPYLNECIGHDIITSDGSTLLGGDDKAGISEIMDMLNYFLTHPEIKHGDISVCFTPDEEIGASCDKFDLKTFDADFAYTVDGGRAGEFEYDNFNACGVKVTFTGKSIHPGYAKDVMINASYIAAKFVDDLSSSCPLPEKTDKMDGFIHCTGIQSSVGTAVVSFVPRTFNRKELDEFVSLIETYAKKTIELFPGSKYDLVSQLQYENMKDIVVKHPALIDNAIAAIKRVGIEPIIEPVRGGTDGAMLATLYDFAAPNIFCGEQNFHSLNEWISVNVMEQAVRTLVELVQIFEETV